MEEECPNFFSHSTTFLKGNNGAHQSAAALAASLSAAGGGVVGHKGSEGARRQQRSTKPLSETARGRGLGEERRKADSIFARIVTRACSQSRMLGSEQISVKERDDDDDRDIQMLQILLKIGLRDGQARPR
jgi:hypothetical protein